MGDAVAGLNLADELVAAALDLEQVVIRKLSPLLLDGSLGLGPASLDLLPDGLAVRLGRGLGVNDGRQGTDGKGGTGRQNGKRSHMLSCLQIGRFVAPQAEQRARSAEVARQRSGP